MDVAHVHWPQALAFPQGDAQRYQAKELIIVPSAQDVTMVKVG